MAFSDMNDVEQELGEEKPPQRNGNGNRTFLIIAGTLGGIMVLALLCIAGLALYRYIPAQQAARSISQTQGAQNTAAALAASQTREAQNTAVALSDSQTAAAPTFTATTQPTTTPTKTASPTKTPLVVILPSKSPTLDIAVATRNALLTQTAVHAQGSQTIAPATIAPTETQPEPTETQPQPTATQFQPTATKPQTATTQPQLTSTSIAPSFTPAKPTSTALPGTGIAEDLGTPGLMTAALVLLLIVFVVRRLRTAT